MSFITEVEGHYRISLRQATPDATQAEACFQQALATVRRRQAKSWELRAAMSLRRLWRQQGQRAEARALLAPIYGWFTRALTTRPAGGQDAAGGTLMIAASPRLLLQQWVNGPGRRHPVGVGKPKTMQVFCPQRPSPGTSGAGKSMLAGGSPPFCRR